MTLQILDGAESFLAKDESPMPKVYFSDFFEVSQASLDDHGAFNISLINDLPLFVDPFLLFGAEKPVYRKLHDGVIKYVRFLKTMSVSGSIDPGLEAAWFTFSEVRQNWLGFSRTGNRGHGLGKDFARSLRTNLRNVFKDFGEEDITASSHLEKLCLIRDGVGRDNISDLTTNLIKGFLASYTEKFALTHVAPTLRRCVPVAKAEFDFSTRTWLTRRYELPFLNGDYILLTPKDILTKDETWINRLELLDRLTEIADASPDGVLRAQVNEYFVRMLPSDSQWTTQERREAASRVLERFPELLDHYILSKERNKDHAISVAQGRVTLAEEQFVGQVAALTQLLLPLGFYSLRGNTLAEARKRLEFLKDVIENKGGHHLFYVGGKPIRREVDLQILYRLTWFATRSDVTREANDGRGPADFKVSRGSKDKTIVEFKLAKNSQLKRNLQKQAEIYERASDATNPSLKAIVYFTQDELARVNKILEELKMIGSPNIVLIDARRDNKPSGSRA